MWGFLLGAYAAVSVLVLWRGGDQKHQNEPDRVVVVAALLWPLFVVFLAVRSIWRKVATR